MQKSLIICELITYDIVGFHLTSPAMIPSQFYFGKGKKASPGPLDHKYLF